jgi:hypothetical protein
MFARIEPMTAEVATCSRPARSANSAMNSSGRLPSALCRTPVAPGFSPLGQLVDGAADQRREHRDRGRAHDEGEDGVDRARSA